MLTAHSESFWRGSFVISVDGRPVAHWEPRAWRTGARIDLGGRALVMGGVGFSGYRLTEGDRLLAVAHRAGRRRWSIEEAGGRVHRFQRASIWRGDQDLVDSSERVLGGVRRTSHWSGDVEAHLPGLDLPVQVFAVGIVLALWQAASTTAATSAAT